MIVYHSVTTQEKQFSNADEEDPIGLKIVQCSA